MIEREKENIGSVFHVNIFECPNCIVHVDVHMVD